MTNRSTYTSPPLIHPLLTNPPTNTSIIKPPFHPPQPLRNPPPMALEWVVLGYAAAAEAVMMLLVTLPGLDSLRKGLIAVTTSLLKPFLSMVPVYLFRLAEIYWKYETRPSCESVNCSPSEYLHHQKSIMKSQRNALLIATALVFYWILYSVTKLVVRVDQLNQRIDKLTMFGSSARTNENTTPVALTNHTNAYISGFHACSAVTLTNHNGGFRTRSEW